MRKRLVAAALLSAAVTLVGAPAAEANDFFCTGTASGVINGNVIVPEGASCAIGFAFITGNVKALRGSSLYMTGGATVLGNVEADRAREVQIWVISFIFGANFIYGNGVLVEDSFATSICGTIVKTGNISVVNNRGSFLAIGGGQCVGGGNSVEQGNIKVEDSVITGVFDVSFNRVRQNVQVYKNTAPVMSVQGNTAGESVQCFDNVGTFVGGPNTAPKKEGQCS